jgi:hypothetical protein
MSYAVSAGGVAPPRLKVGLEDDFEAFKADLESQRAYNQRWGRNHNVAFHVIHVLGAIVAVFAIVSDFSGIRGGSMIGLGAGALVAVPSAFKMKEKSFWYFEYASQLDAILYRLGSRALDHAQAVEEFIRLGAAMTDVWKGLTRSIDIKPVVEAAKEGATKRIHPKGAASRSP